MELQAAAQHFLRKWDLADEDTWDQFVLKFKEMARSRLRSREGAFKSGGSARRGNKGAVHTLGGGTVIASPVLRYQAAVKYRLPAMHRREEAFTDQAKAHWPVCKLPDPLPFTLPRCRPLERKVYMENFQVTSPRFLAQGAPTVPHVARPTTHPRENSALWEGAPSGTRYGKKSWGFSSPHYTAGNRTPTCQQASAAGRAREKETTHGGQFLCCKQFQ